MRNRNKQKVFNLDLNLIFNEKLKNSIFKVSKKIDLKLNFTKNIKENFNLINKN